MFKRQYQSLVAVTVISLISISSSANAQLFGWFRNRQQQQPQQQQQYQQYPPTYYYQGQSPDYYSYPYGTPQQPAAQPAPKKTSRKSASSQASKSSKAAANESVDGWMSNWNSAFEKGKRLGRPVVLIFVHEGCPECDKLEATLSRPDAAATLDSAVKVKVEFSDSAELVHRYGIQFTPTFMVFGPGSTTEAYREVGALSVDRLQLIKPSIDSLVTAAN